MYSSFDRQIFFSVAKNSIRLSWFQHKYAGISLGFARDHRSSEAYVRCLFCKCDLKVGSRGISTYLEHCRGVIHHKLDCLVRSRRGLLLRRRTGALMSALEAAAMEEELRGLSLPEVEVCPPFSVVKYLQSRREATVSGIKVFLKCRLITSGACGSFCVWFWTRCTKVETSRVSPNCGIRLRPLMSISEPAGQWLSENRCCRKDILHVVLELHVFSLHVCVCVMFNGIQGYYWVLYVFLVLDHCRVCDFCLI